MAGGFEMVDEHRTDRRHHNEGEFSRYPPNIIVVCGPANLGVQNSDRIQDLTPEEDAGPYRGMVISTAHRHETGRGQVIPRLPSFVRSPQEPHGLVDQQDLSRDERRRWMRFQGRSGKFIEVGQQEIIIG